MRRQLMRLRRRGGNERGSALVETAIILPVILVLTFGALEFGFALSDASGLRSSVRSGARIGAALSRQPTQLPAVVDAVNEGLKSLSFAKSSHLLVYTGKASDVSKQITNCTTTSAMCVDITTLSSTNKFDATAVLAEWDPSREDVCVGEAWKLGVTVVATYKGLTKLVAVPHTFTATMLIDLEPTISSSCK